MNMAAILGEQYYVNFTYVRLLCCRKSICPSVGRLFEMLAHRTQRVEYKLKSDTLEKY